MNVDIANIVKAKISSLPYVDQIAGLVRVVTKTDNDGDKSYTKLFPVSCSASQEDCTTGNYKSLTPNTKYKSIIYFEDGGVSVLNRNDFDLNFESKLTLVCWLNQKKLGKTGCSISALAIGSMLKALQVDKFFNSSPYVKMQISVENEIVKSADIFSKYSYDEKVTQYLLYPFDYFALNLKIKYSIREVCLTDFANETEVCE